MGFGRLTVAAIVTSPLISSLFTTLTRALCVSDEPRTVLKSNNICAESDAGYVYLWKPTRVVEVNSAVTP